MKRLGDKTGDDQAHQSEADADAETGKQIGIKPLYGDGYPQDG